MKCQKRAGNIHLTVWEREKKSVQSYQVTYKNIHGIQSHIYTVCTSTTHEKEIKIFEMCNAI